MKRFVWFILTAMNSAVASQDISANLDGRLRLTAEMQHEIEAYSTAKVQIEVLNIGREVVSITDFPLPSLLRIELRDVLTHSIRARGYVGSGVGNVREAYTPPVALAPGERRSFHVVIGCLRDENNSFRVLPFETPGTYDIRFLYPIAFGVDGGRATYNLETQWMPLRIKELDPRLEGAYREFRSLPNPCWIFNPDEVSIRAPSAETGEWARHVAEMLSQYPESPWTDNARLSLAHYYHACAIHKSGHIDERMLERALHELEQIREIQPSYITRHAGVLKASILRKSSRDLDEGAGREGPQRGPSLNDK
jgi:hypothetical protein